MSKQAPILQLTDVTKIYENGAAGTTAVSEVNITIEKASFTGIMGASGSGKSTLLNLMAAIDTATSGSILFQGKELAGMNENDLALFRQQHLGFIFQDYNLLDTLTLKENIVLALMIKKISGSDLDTRVLEAARALGIEELLDRFPQEVSGGQRQRCACARALAAFPYLILADEPTGALDSKSSAQLMETLCQINRENAAAVLMVTHDPVSASYCDRILFMEDGSIKREIKKESRSRTDFLRIIIEEMAGTGRAEA